MSDKIQNISGKVRFVVDLLSCWKIFTERKQVTQKTTQIALFKHGVILKGFWKNEYLIPACKSEGDFCGTFIHRKVNTLRAEKS